MDDDINFSHENTGENNSESTDPNGFDENINPENYSPPSEQDVVVDEHINKTSIPSIRNTIDGVINPDSNDFGIINILSNGSDAEVIWGNVTDQPGISDSHREASSLGEIFGEPSEDMKHWHEQERPDSCAIVSQEFVLKSFGRDITESELVEHAINEGYYIPGYGTFPYDVGNILEDYNIAVEKTEGNNFDDLLEKLNKNQKIIVAVDSNEIWANSAEQQLIDLFGLSEANHAVEVIGYNSESQTVILNDPGHPNGRGLEVSLRDFENAWQDSNNFMVFTKQSAPSIT